MKNLEIKSMPEFLFAHSFDAENYRQNMISMGNKIEITYIKEGSITIKKGEETFKAEKGDIICIIYDDNIEIYSDKYHCHHTMCVRADYEFCENDVYGFRVPYVTKHQQDTDEIEKAIDRFINSRYMYEKSPTRTANAFLDILCKIDDISRRDKNFEPSKESLWSIKVKKYVQKNIYRSITQTEIAKSLGVSTGYLCSIFKKSEGMSVMKYVNSTKLRGIHALMQKENLKLYEAAQLYGYSDPNYVSALYKRLFGKNITDDSE